MQMKEIKRLTGHGGGTLVVCWYGGRVISGGADGKVRVWDVEGGGVEAEAAGHDSEVTSMWVFGDRLVTGGVDGMVKVWGLGGGGLKREQEFNVAEGARGGAKLGVSSVCGYGGRVYSGVAAEEEGTGNDVLVWEVEGGRYVSSMKGHKSWVTGMAVLMEGKFLATVSYDCTVRIWSIENRQAKFFSQANREPGQVGKDPSALLGVAALPAGGDASKGTQGLVTISEGGMVDVWEVSTGSGMVEVKHVEGGRHGEGELEGGSVSVVGGRGGGGKDRWRVVSAGSEGRVKMWGVGETGGWEAVESVAVEGGKYAIAGCSGREADGQVVLGLGWGRGRGGCRVIR